MLKTEGCVMEIRKANEKYMEIIFNQSYSMG